LRHRVARQRPDEGTADPQELTPGWASIQLTSFGANLFASSAAPAAAFYSPWKRFCGLMIGAMLACRAPRLPASAARPAWGTAARPRIAATVSIAGIVLIVLGIVFAREKISPGWQALLTTGGTALLILAGPRAPVNRMLLSRGVLTRVALEFELHEAKVRSPPPWFAPPPRKRSAPRG